MRSQPILATLLLMAFLLAWPVAAKERWSDIAELTILSPLAVAERVDGPYDGIAQDADGFIWFTAAGRLWRWDSRSLEAAKFEGISEAAGSPEALSLASDSHGDIWLGTSRGLFKSRRGSLTLSPYPLPGDARPRVQQLQVVDAGSGRPLLVMASDREVSIVDGKPGSRRAVALAGAPRIHDLLVDRNHRLWIATGSGLFEMPLKPGSKRPPVNAGGAFSGNRVETLFEDSRGRLWVGTAHDGAFVRDPGGPFRSVPLGAAGTPPWIFSIAEARSGTMWLGSFGHGLFEVEVEGMLARNHRSRRLLRTSLADDNIWSLFTDRRGLVWIGSSLGLGLHDPRMAALKQVPGDVGNESGLGQRGAFAFANGAGSLWVGSDHLHVEHFSPLEGRVSRTVLEGVGTSATADPVETLHAEPDGSLVAGTNFATWKIPATGAPRVWTIPGRDTREFTSAIARWDGHLWLGGTDGLWRISDSPAAAPVNVMAKANRDRRVASLLAEEDYLWLGTWQGLMRMGRDGRIEAVPHPLLDQQFVSSMRRDARGRLWIGSTGAGIFILAQSGDWRRVSEAEGLPSRIVADMRFDSLGRAWTSTERGLAIVDVGSLRVTPVAIGPASVAGPYYRGASVQLGPDEFAFGGRHGFTVVDARRYRIPPRSVPLVLSAVEPSGGKASAPAVTPDPGAPMVMPGGTTRLSLEFTALDFVDGGDILYRYRLLGYEDEWREADAAHRIATYTSLPPGDYMFEVQYSRDGGAWGEPGLRQPVRMLPSWHQHPLFRGLLVLLAALLVLGVHRVRTRLLRHRAQQLEQAVRQRTNELAEVNARLAQQAGALEQASLTDPLTGLRNRRFLSQVVEADLAQARAQGRDILAILIDIDQFKSINDRFGHAAGDAVLVEFARRLQSLFSEAQHLVRWGGEEFLVVCHDVERGRAGAVAEGIHLEVASRPFEYAPGEFLPLTCSTGYVVFPLDRRNPDALDWGDALVLADLALYAAKNAGRNTWMGIEGLDCDAGEAALLRSDPAELMRRADLRRRTD